MPRYELVEGKSKKFWQIEREGSSFTTTFGRIGTAGQSKAKDFSDEAAATRAYEKLVREKVAKGYALVDAEPAPTASAPAEPPPPESEPPPPAEAPSPVSGAGRLIWSEALDPYAPSSVDDQSADSDDPLAGADAATLYAKINAWASPAVKPAIEQGIAASTSHKERVNKVVWSYFAPAPPATLDLETEATAFILFGSAPVTGAAEMARTMVRFWAAHSGLPFALEAWVKSLEPFNGAGYGWGRDGLTPRHCLVDAPGGATEARVQRHGGPAILRRLLAEATPDARAEARARAQKLREGGELIARIGLAEVFRDADWLRADAASAEEGESIIAWAPEFFLGALSCEALVSLFERLDADECFELVAHSTRYQGSAGRLIGLLHLHREAGLLPIAAWVRRAAEHLAEEDEFSYGLGHGLANVLSEVLRLLAPHVRDSAPVVGAAIEVLARADKLKLSKDVDPRPAAIEVLRAMPELALPEVERAAKRNLGWAKRLLPQLERLTGSAEQAPAVAMDALPAELRGKGFAKAPAFFSAELLPQLVLPDGRALPPEAVETLGEALAKGRGPVIEAAKASCTEASLAAFAWELFNLWEAANGPAKEKWALLALGHFGDDECARRLTAFIRRWPGESQHKRAVLGLDVLAAIGSDTAMMCLNGIAQKVRYKALQKNARAKMQEIATRRGLTEEELQDRLVPDFDLEDDGSMELDFGPRSFRVGFDERLVPFVIDAKGKRRASLPKPGAKDDADVAEEAVARFKAMKKDVRTLASIELARLEQAMGRRRWPAADFEAFLVHHPLMVHVVRRLVWAELDADGRPARRFRVAEDRTYADVEDEELTLGDDAMIGLAHRIHLDDDEAAAWQAVFRSYELEPPFPQLDRDVYRLEPSDVKGDTIVRFERREVETKRLIGLQSRGWRHGTPEDAGVYTTFSKPIRGDLSAWLLFETGIPIGAPEYAGPTQLLGHIEFATTEPWRWGGSSQQATPLASIDEATISEVLRDVASLPEYDRG